MRKPLTTLVLAAAMTACDSTSSQLDTRHRTCRNYAQVHPEEKK